ncbi:EutP/PduV family microcompartment system protein [Desulfovibrio sp. OttesenSCG-928-G15]|nr:EutP/PduV family microcompartment system protein [Desulfovibrio sp. OttesenSCG-928-G15]
MKKMMLIGEVGAGKSSLIRAMSDNEFASSRAMSVQYHGPFINTPGEFLENRRFYPAIITASTGCDIMALLQSAERNISLYPPLCCSFFNKHIIGIITKMDSPTARPDRAARFLQSAGVKELYYVSSVTGEGLDALRGLLV